MTRGRGRAAVAKDAHGEPQHTKDSQLPIDIKQHVQPDPTSSIATLQQAERTLADSVGGVSNCHSRMGIIESHGWSYGGVANTWGEGNEQHSGTSQMMEQWLADGEPAHPWDGGKWDPVNDQNQGVLSSGSFEKKPVTRRTTKKGKKGRGKVAKRDVNKEFEVYFGDECKLVNWQRLACDLGLEGNFSSITQCRKAFRNVWVNIVDFMDALYARNTSNASKFLTSDAMDALNIEKWHVDSTGSSHVNINALNVIMSALNVNANNQLVSMGPVDVKKFCSQKSLGKYTRKTKKFYPLNKAKKEGPIRALLAHIR